MPLETQKLIKTNQNNVKYNENSQEIFGPTEELNYKGTLKSKYQIFLILQKNERLEIISDNLRIAEGLIKALTKKCLKLRTNFNVFVLLKIYKISQLCFFMKTKILFQNIYFNKKKSKNIKQLIILFHIY